MPNSYPAALMYEIISVRDEIDRLAAVYLTAEGRFFHPVSLPMPKFAPAELGFIRTISWLYVLYYEAGKVGVQFVADRFPAYSLDPDESHRTHHRIINRMRTFLQHNLNPSANHDNRTRELCWDWFRLNCGTPEPASESHWEKCLSSVLKSARGFVMALRDCLRAIEKDDSRDVILRDLEYRYSRYHSPAEFDSLIHEVAVDLGRDEFDETRLRKRFYDKWVDELAQLKPGYIFEVEARKRIEHALLFDIPSVLPIDGHDIMKVFGLRPGIKVGELLTQAYMLYQRGPCPRDELLKRLVDENPGVRETLGTHILNTG